MTESETVPAAVGRGVAAGLLATVVMTAFQRFVEMPLTGRGESYAPISLIEKLTPARPTGSTRRALNYVAHFGVGATWGAVHALLARRTGLSGQPAIGAAFGVFYAGDVVGNTALGLTRPWDWSAQDLVVDVVDKLVLAEATGVLFDVLDPSN